FPDFLQANLASSELRASGAGPVAAINLFEWWGIPIYNGATLLSTLDARASYLASRMDTLSGLNFTDDDELIDFLASYPAQLYQAGRIAGYPAYHHMRGDRSGWKVMMSYLSRGYPVLALYSSSSSSLH